MPHAQFSRKGLPGNCFLQESDRVLAKTNSVPLKILKQESGWMQLRSDSNTESRESCNSISGN